MSNPATGLKGFRITKKDRPTIDPLSVDEAEALVTAIHRDWSEAQDNYDEFRFFTGLRPSEQIVLLVSDCDLNQAKVKVTKARLMARDKDRTKTSEDRLIELCPRALEVLKRQLALRKRLRCWMLTRRGREGRRRPISRPSSARWKQRRSGRYAKPPVTPPFPW